MWFNLVTAEIRQNASFRLVFRIHSFIHSGEEARFSPLGEKGRFSTEKSSLLQEVH